MKKIVLFSIFTLVFLISCEKEKTPVVDEMSDEDIEIIDESVDEVSDEFSDPDEFDGEADELADIDEEFDNEPDEDVVTPLRL
jgi:archaellum component FlaC